MGQGGQVGWARSYGGFCEGMYRLTGDFGKGDVRWGRAGRGDGRGVTEGFVKGFTDLRKISGRGCEVGEGGQGGWARRRVAGWLAVAGCGWLTG